MRPALEGRPGGRRRRPPGRAAAVAAFGLALGVGACSPGSESDERTGAAAADETTEAARSASVDRLFSDLSSDGPGAAVVVRYGGQVVHRAGYGIAHLDHQVPITPSTVFDIASISKQFGAMAALLLEADGRLDLDADVRVHVPELPDFGPTITPRHLIHHTSGIRDWPHAMGLGGVEMTDVISFDKILRMLFNQRALNFEPGSEYAYSNTGYNLLALVIERASGRTFREYTEQNIFQPLGMDRTHFSDDYGEVVPGRAESYSPAPRPEGPGRWQRRANQLTALASSSLHTTIDDFAKWMENYETGRVGGADIESRMTRRGVLANGDTIAYAYGLSVGEYRGLATYGHGGSWAGYRTNFVRFPEQDLSVAVFCNVSDCDPTRRAREVAEVYVGDRMAEPEPDEPQDRPEAGPSLSAEALAEFAGSYRSPEVDATYTLVVRDGTLVAEHWRAAPVPLTPTAPDRFRGRGAWFPDVRFIRNDGGRIRAFAVTGPRVRDLMFTRIGTGSEAR